MKTSRQTKFRIAAFVVALTTFLVSPGLPPDKLFEPANRAGFAVGIMITLKVTPEGERPLRVSQLEGGLIKIGKEGQATYTFSPTVTDPDGGPVTIKVFLDDMAGRSGEAASGLKEARTLVVEKEGNKYLVAHYADADSSFRIEVISVKTGPWSVDGPLEALNYADASDKCCLSCGDRLICGYAMSMACGGCYDVRWGSYFEWPQICGVPFGWLLVFDLMTAIFEGSCNLRLRRDQIVKWDNDRLPNRRIAR